VTSTKKASSHEVPPRTLRSDRPEARRHGGPTRVAHACYPTPLLNTGRASSAPIAVKWNREVVLIAGMAPASLGVPGFELFRELAPQVFRFEILIPVVCEGTRNDLSRKLRCEQLWHVRRAGVLGSSEADLIEGLADLGQSNRGVEFFEREHNERRHAIAKRREVRPNPVAEEWEVHGVESSVADPHADGGGWGESFVGPGILLHVVSLADDLFQS
jgi:hypothetical protein